MPKYMMFLLAGGMGLLMLKEAVGLIRLVGKLMGGGRSGQKVAGQTLEQGNIEQSVKVEQGKENPGDIKYEILEKIFECTSETNKAVGDLAVEVATMKTQVAFLARTQGAQNGDVKSLTKAIVQMKEACAARLLNCERRFSGLHEKVVKGE